MFKNKAMASFLLAILSWCLWPFGIVPGLAVAVVSLAFAAGAFRAGRRRLVLGGLAFNLSGAVVFLGFVPAIQSLQEAARRTDIV